MKEAYVETVRPADARKEVCGLLVAVMVVLVAWAAFLHNRSRADETVNLATWQVSAFRDLNGAEQGVYADLRLAAEEIYQICLDGKETWPRLDALRDNGIAPFTADAAWINRGKIHWNARLEALTGIDRIVFLGERSGAALSGAFLLEVHHQTTVEQDGPPYRVWYHAGRPSMPAAENWEYLAQLGWREVVAYEGQDELHRLKGSRL